MIAFARGPVIRGAALALAAFGIFSTHDVLVKFLGGTYAPFQLVFLSTLFGFPVATIMLMRDPADGNLRPVHPWWTLLRTGAAVIVSFNAFYAFSTLPLAQVYAIIFAAPILITILAVPILGERVGWRRSLAVVVGLIGVLVVLRPGGTDLELGHLAALMAAVFSALAAVIIRKIGRDERSAVLLLYPMMANFLVMGCVLPFVYRPMPGLHFGMVAAMAVLGFSAALCQIAAYRLAPAVIVAPMQYSQILWATAYGALFFGETPDRTTAIGATIIIGSGIYIVLREYRRSTTSHAPVMETQTRFASGPFPRVSAILRALRRDDPPAPGAGPGPEP